MSQLKRLILPIVFLVLVTSLIGCVQEHVWLVPEKGPFILAETIKARVGIETPPGSGTIVWSTEPQEIPRGLTVMYYDWSKKVK